jgi:hypothetical protein
MKRGSSVVVALSAVLFAACSTGGDAGGGAGGHAGGAGRGGAAGASGRGGITGQGGLPLCESPSLCGPAGAGGRAGGGGVGEAAGRGGSAAGSGGDGPGVTCGATRCGVDQICCTSCTGTKSCSAFGCPAVACLVDGGAPDGGGGGGAAGGAGAAGHGGSGGASGVLCGADRCETGQVCCTGCDGTKSCGQACLGVACPVDAGAGACSSLTTLASCDARSDCHAVFDDPGTCGCASPGCCAHFSKCADGGKASCTMPSTFGCTTHVPFCEAPYVVGYTSSCYEGCVRATACP